VSPSSRAIALSAIHFVRAETIGADFTDLTNVEFINCLYLISMAKRYDFSPRGWSRVALVTCLGTLGTMAVALLGVDYTTQFMPPHVANLTWLMAIVLPVVMTGPILYYFSSKLRQLAIAQHELALIASRDSLTTCLNRGAFVTLVDAYLSQVNSSHAIEGALLVVDADHFKGINDRFGHANGDIALRLIAQGLKDEVRPTDLVGRIGGEEFGVFLPKTDARQALVVAERMRRRIAQAVFAPNGVPAEISVSIGAAVFDSPVSYETLFRSADRLLYEAKNSGRNRVVHRFVRPGAA
jgi:diguanylate cyclase (GGDEF)-like protein